MAEELKKVDRAIEEHHTIKGHMKLVGDSVSDLEALFSLQNMSPEWKLSTPEALPEKQKKLQRTIGALDEGVKNHFAFEERLFPPLFGEVLMRALKLEHREIRKQLSEAKSLVFDTKLEGLNQKELLSKKSQIQQKVEDVLQVIEEHALKEETLLKMVKKALEEKD